MTSASILNPGFDRLEHPLPQNTILVIGAGHFGQRAVRILAANQGMPILLIDWNKDWLNNIKDANVTKIMADGVQFLSEYYAFLDPFNIIIPAIPSHLALEWLKRHINEKYKPLGVNLLPIPKKLPRELPHTWDGNDGSLLISYADFKCPDDCPEPAEACTVTGEQRLKPLHALLAEINPSGFQNHVIASRQLAPGLGGYAFAELQRLLDRVIQSQKASWLIGTACKCHGIMTAMEVT